MIEHLVRSVAYVGFGLWLVVHTISTPGFVWLHAAFLLFAVAMTAVGLLTLLGPRWSGPGSRVLAVALGLFGVLLLAVGTSPFGLLALALGLQLFPWNAKRPAPGAGDGPLGSQHSQP